ncbi:hypothetical protein BH24ACI2_BH24ACI2_13070 [soil metagenome]
MKNFVSKNKGLFSFIMLFVLTFMSNQIAFSQFVCQPSGSPIAQSGVLATTDPTQTGRVFRDGFVSSCAGGAPTQAPLAGTYRYDKYDYSNPTGQAACATLDFDFTGCGGNMTQVTVYSNYNPASPGTGIIGTSGFSSTGIGSLSFPLTAGQNFTVVIAEVGADTGCPSYKFTINYATGCRQAGFDRTNDGRADITVWRPSNGVWYTLNSAGGFNVLRFGQSGDITTAGDYTGDGQTDVSVYRPSNNTWYYGLSQTTPGTSFVSRPFGVAGDIPVPGDYDRDGKTDIAVWRPSNGFWYALRSSDNTLLSRQWGQNGDVPVVGDFDGDRINDFAVVRNNNGVNKWLILQSNFNYGFVLGCPSTAAICGGGVDFGSFTSDKLVPGDYDGNGKTDIAVWRPSNGTWYYLRSGVAANVAMMAYQFGASGDIPQPADYDGDKRTDFAVFRPSGASGIWYLNSSQTNTASGVQWGAATDQPATSPYKVQ